MSDSGDEADPAGRPPGITPQRKQKISNGEEISASAVVGLDFDVVSQDTESGIEVGDELDSEGDEPVRDGASDASESEMDAFLVAEKVCETAMGEASAAASAGGEVADVSFSDRLTLSEDGLIGLFVEVVNRPGGAVASEQDPAAVDQDAEEEQTAEMEPQIQSYLAARFGGAAPDLYPVVMEAGGDTAGWFVRVPFNAISAGWLRSGSGRVLLSPSIVSNDPDERQRARESSANDPWSLSVRAWTGLAPDQQARGSDGAPFVADGSFFRPSALTTVLIRDRRGKFANDKSSLFEPLLLDLDDPLISVREHITKTGEHQWFITLPTPEARSLMDRFPDLYSPLMAESRPSLEVANRSFDAKEYSDNTLFLNFPASAVDPSITSKDAMRGFVCNLVQQDLPSSAIRVLCRKPRRSRRRSGDSSSRSTPYKRWTVLLTIADHNTRDAVLRAAYPALSLHGGLVRYAWRSARRQPSTPLSPANTVSVHIPLDQNPDLVATVTNRGGSCVTVPTPAGQPACVIACVPEEVAGEIEGLPAEAEVDPIHRFIAALYHDLVTHPEAWPAVVADRFRSLGCSHGVASV